MMINGEELKERLNKALEELSENEIYVRLQDVQGFFGNVCTWTCDECKCNYDPPEFGVCKMQEFLENLPKYQPTMEKVRGMIHNEDKMGDAQEYHLKRRPCNRICGRFEFAPDECKECWHNEGTNPIAKQFREKKEAERKAWEGQQGAL